LVDKPAHPIRQAEDLVNHHDRGGLLLHLRISYETLHFACAVFDGHPLQVARGFLESGFARIFRGKGGSERNEGKQEE
jgi:hypothetical protein